MSDDCDATDARMEIELRGRIAADSRIRPEAAPRGDCYNCGEPLPSPMRWCDKDCQHDWTRRRDNDR